MSKEEIRGLLEKMPHFTTGSSLVEGVIANDVYIGIKRRHRMKEEITKFWISFIIAFTSVVAACFIAMWALYFFNRIGII